MRTFIEIRLNFYLHQYNPQLISPFIYRLVFLYIITHIKTYNIKPGVRRRIFQKNIENKIKYFLLH